MEVYQDIGTPVLTLNLREDILFRDKKDTWHDKDSKKQHISQLTLCGLKTAFTFINPKPLSMRSKGVFLRGNEVHKTVQKAYILKYSGSVMEFPVKVRVIIATDDGDIEFEITGKIDILDFMNSRIIDVKTSNKMAMKWIKSGSSKNPPGAKPSHIIQVVVYWYIWNYVIIRDPKSPYWIKECGILYVNTEDYSDIYCPIPLDRYDAQVIYQDLGTEAVGVHTAINLDDWVYLKNKWHYNPEWWLCKGYCDYTEECKRLK